jgi:hypothetical protein
MQAGPSSALGASSEAEAHALGEPQPEASLGSLINGLMDRTSFFAGDAEAAHDATDHAFPAETAIMPAAPQVATARDPPAIWGAAVKQSADGTEAAEAANHGALESTAAPASIQEQQQQVANEEQQQQADDDQAVGNVGKVAVVDEMRDEALPTAVLALASEPRSNVFSSSRAAAAAAASAEGEGPTPFSAPTHDRDEQEAASAAVPAASALLVGSQGDHGAGVPQRCQPPPTPPAPEASPGVLAAQVAPSTASVGPPPAGPSPPPPAHATPNSLSGAVTAEVAGMDVQALCAVIATLREGLGARERQIERQAEEAATQVRMRRHLSGFARGRTCVPSTNPASMCLGGSYPLKINPSTYHLTYPHPTTATTTIHEENPQPNNPHTSPLPATLPQASVLEQLQRRNEELVQARAAVSEHDLAEVQKEYEARLAASDRRIYALTKVG